MAFLDGNIEYFIRICYIYIRVKEKKMKYPNQEYSFSIGKKSQSLIFHLIIILRILILKTGI